MYSGRAEEFSAPAIFMLAKRQDASGRELPRREAGERRAERQGTCDRGVSRRSALLSTGAAFFGGDFSAVLHPFSMRTRNELLHSVHLGVRSENGCYHVKVVMLPSAKESKRGTLK